MHHHLELVAAGQQLAAGGVVGLGGQGDPVEVAAEAVHTAGFQMQGQVGAGGVQGGAQVAQRMLQGLAAGDHHKGRAGFSGFSGGGGQGMDRAVGMGRLGPGVFRVTPGATHAAAAEADEEGPRPAWTPSPCREWKVSTTGRLVSGLAAGAGGSGAMNGRGARNGGPASGGRCPLF